MNAEELDFELPTFVEPVKDRLRFDVEFIRALDHRRTEQWKTRRAHDSDRTRESAPMMISFVWED
jgi:hypothetical protein